MLVNFEKLCSYNVVCKPLPTYGNGQEYIIVSTRFFIGILTVRSRIVSEKRIIQNLYA